MMNPSSVLNVILVSLLSCGVTAWEPAAVRSVLARRAQRAQTTLMCTGGNDVTKAAASEPPLCMVERKLPIMEPKEYERALRQWARETGSGDIVRWYISNVDEGGGEATAEIVLVRSSTQ